MSCMAAAGFHQYGHSWSQPPRLRKQEPRQPLLHESCHTLNSLGDGSSGSMIEHILQHNILYIEKLHVCNDGFILLLPTLISYIYNLTCHTTLTTTNFNVTPNKTGKRENYIFPIAKKIVNNWMVIRIFKIGDNSSRRTPSLVVSKAEFSQKMVAQLLLKPR